MDPTVVVFAVVAALAVFVIAALVVGREAHRLDSVAPRAVYSLDEATDFVCDRIPVDSQARLTPGEVEQLLVFHMQWLHTHGLQPDRVIDQRQSIDDRVVITEDGLTAYLLGEADRNDVDLLDDVDAVHVVEAHLAYFEAIGAVGPRAPLDDVIE
ncbi:hypothetical protein [Ilumatobacter sp.]|uniref:hypothetical protein n=1 Tax=Ilumatobacter sp. TaxID=1967498 RepID=UPI003B52E845